MEFSFSDDQTAIRDLANQIFSDRASDEHLLTLSRNKQSVDENLWRTLAEQGLLGVCVPAAFGGSDLGFVELCLLLEEQGRRVAPVPLFSSLVLGALPIIEFGSEQQQQTYLPALVSGEIKLTAAIAELGMNALIAPVVKAKQQGDTWVLSGEKHAVTDGMIADFILLPAVDEKEQQHIFVLDVNLLGVTRVAQENSLGSDTALLQLDQVSIGAQHILGQANQGQAMLDWLELRAETALCAMQLGVCEDALRRTAEFTTERKQFGTSLGSFQAVAMRAADAYIDIEAMRSVYWQAMWRLSENIDAQAEVYVAKWWACHGSHRVVHATQHLHGGMGSDVDFPIHRFFLWAKQIAFMLGNANMQMQKLGKYIAKKSA